MLVFWTCFLSLYVCYITRKLPFFAQRVATLPGDVQKTLTHKADSTFKQSSGLETVSRRELEKPLTSAEPSVSTHVPVDPDSKLVKQVEVYLKDNRVNSSSRETEEQDYLNEDNGGSNDSDSDESESEIEVIICCKKF